MPSNGKKFPEKVKKEGCAVRIFKAGSVPGKRLVERLKRRGQKIPARLERGVRRILAEVRRRGDEALVDYTRRFDCPNFEVAQLRVREEEIFEAYREVSPEILSALRLAIRNVEEFHRRQLSSSWFYTRPEGVFLGQMVRPVSSAGLYVPGGAGGETPLISTVVMTAVPARVAGVPRVAMVSPPNREGRLHPALLVAAAECGVTEIYRVGSAWAIAALAYGTETIRSVSVIAGPGNIYVTVAKKLLYGEVGVDLVAGPSEVLIVADESASAEHLAWDLLAQAEHDPLATALLLTPSGRLARKVKEALLRALERLPRREIAEAALKGQGGILVTRDLEEALELANAIAPEHLELAVADPFALLPRVKNAGAVFLGGGTPEALGDYVAGPNHVLPTMGAARFASALSVEVFLRRISLLSYGPEALAWEGEAAVRLAETEGLFAHAEAVRVRLKSP
ncbi:histidinol dehydrogenase [Thermosulfurimonas marina]|uniref:Histidinol dehydrogenase n=1 Tax=Thermosulfurimonas marina TaxID=2047767 RepID=A0A6H1WUY6_9BACT|nr:histidinol dehydrogenase [Thermosulfurimonas marina]QJA06998.1 histidinol dehydrogenase [Thermosulfurimonas marina]